MVGRQVDLTLLLLQLALKSSTTEGAAAAEEDEASPEQPEPPELRAVGVAAACLPGAVTTSRGGAACSPWASCCHGNQSAPKASLLPSLLLAQALPPPAAP